MSLFGRAAQPSATLPKPAPTAGPPPKKPRRTGLGRFSGFLSFLTIAAVAGVGAFAWERIEARRAGPLTADKVVLLTHEDSDGSIGEQLERAGVIDSALWFSALTILDGNSRSLKRGEYEFKASASLTQVEEELIAGKTLLHSLTIPEGLTSDQISQRLKENEFLSGEIKEPIREGSMLPDTYKFARDWPRQKILAKMAEDQTRVVAEIWKKRAPDLPIKSPGELITLASIVEKETGKADERPHVAAVFINRLQKRMKLQSDPTIVYGLVFGKGTLGHSITKTELEQATPYNTYAIEGLPPGPIANPGRAALEAVANPSHTKDLFFVADGTGGHAFAETLEQHLRNVAHWRQIQQDAKDRVAPDVAPAPAGATHGEAAPLDPAAFGGLLAVAAPPASPAPKAPISLANMHSLIDIAGGHVAGVESPVSAPEGTVAGSAPLSPAALADLKARLAKYGARSGAPEALVTASNETAMAAVAKKPRGFDASEGTPLDPLRNQSYDLNSAKTVPNLK